MLRERPRRRSPIAVLLALLVILAGCGANGTSTPTTSTATATSPTTSQTPTPTPTPTPSATPAPSYNNPWNEQTIHVAIDNPTDRDYRAIVRQALRYWETDGRQWADWTDLEFTLLTGADTAEADAVIRFGAVRQCGGDATAPVGCAPYPTGGAFERTPTAEISTGFTNASTQTIVRHEIGHLLGVEHAQTPAFMRPEVALQTLPRLDAVNRTNPWAQETLRVYIDDSAVPQPLEETVSTQLDHALGYYNDGGEGATPDGVRLVSTATRTDADIVIEVVRNSDIEDRAYASVEYSGSNLDEDQQLERVENGTIRVAYNVEGETGYIGYATGYHIGLLLTLDPDPAPPWTDESITYRDQWWERAE